MEESVLYFIYPVIPILINVPASMDLVDIIVILYTIHVHQMVALARTEDCVMLIGQLILIIVAHGI